MATKQKPIVKINGKKYPLIFGFKFLNEVNALKPKIENMDNFVQLIGALQDGDGFAFRELVHAALITYDDLTTEEIDNYLETSDEVIQLFENFILFLQQAPLTALRTKKALEAIEKLTAMMEEMPDEMLEAMLQTETNS